jgi:hypothetical protein
MKRPSVTKAQMTRALAVLEAAGKTVADVILLPDGSWRLRLTDGGGSILPSPDQAEAEWDKALGLR